MADFMACEQVVQNTGHILPNWQIKYTVFGIKFGGANLLVFDTKVLSCHQFGKLRLLFYCKCHVFLTIYKVIIH